MGINGLWDEVRKRASARQVDLAVLSAECMKQNGRPLRVAVDVSLDIYKYSNATQIARTAGGRNHPTRTFFYHVLHYMVAGVQPIFIYDGPQRPPMKRDRFVPHKTPSSASLPPKSASSLRNADDIQKEYEYSHLVDLYRQVLDLLGVPWLEAPGEAEAECVALENAGIVDAICTKDGDAFAFGGAKVFLTCNKKVHRGRTVLPVQIFEAKPSSNSSEVIPKEDLVLLAMMAGGDYNHGIPDYRPDLAMAAAAEGYGKSLNAIANSGSFVTAKLSAWRNKLKADLRNGRFRNRHRHVADKIPDEFPMTTILDLYLRPAVSSEENIQLLRESISWNQPIDIQKLQDFTKEHFHWKGRHFARKFINALCSPLLARAFLRHKEIGEDATAMFTDIKQSRDAVADESPDELRLEFRPADIVGIDWQAEPRMIGYDTQFDQHEKYHPGEPFRDWFPAFLVKYGAPIQYGSWAGSTTRKNSKTKTRKDDSNPVAPSSTEKPLGRPRKTPNGPVSETVDGVPPLPGKKRGRPPKHDGMNTTEVGPSMVSREESNTHSLSRQTSVPRKKIKLLPPIRDEAFIGVEVVGKARENHQADFPSPLLMDPRSHDTLPSSSNKADEDDEVIFVGSRVVGNPYLGGRIEGDPTPQNDATSPSLASIPKKRLEKTTTPFPRAAVIDPAPRRRQPERRLNNSDFIK